MTIEEQIIELLSKTYKTGADGITMDTDIRKDLSSKSIMMLAFISSIENELDVSIPLSESNALNTVQDFVDKVKELS